MRILCVFSQLNIGGAECMTMNILSVANPEMTFDFVVHKSEPGYFDSFVKQKGSTIFVAPNIKQVGIKAYKKWWNNLFGKNHFDIVHGNYRKTAVIYLKIAKSNNVSTILHLHSGSSSNFFAVLFRKFISHRIYKQLDYVFSCSDKASCWFFGKKYKQLNNIVNIPNGIQTNKYVYNPDIRKKLREELQILPNELVVGHVGRFYKVKNHVFLIDVFVKILEISPHSKLILVGDGPLRSKTENYCRKKGILSSVLFLGNRDDVSSLLQAFDVFVLPSLFEGLPLSLIEAQSSSLPSVFSSSISKEAIVSEYAFPISLTNEASVWARTIIKLSKLLRFPIDLSNSKFDISVSSRTVFSLYNKLYENKKV